MIKGELEKSMVIFKSVGLFDTQRVPNTYSIRALMTMTKYYILEENTPMVAEMIKVLVKKEDDIFILRQQIELDTYKCYLDYQQGNMKSAFERLKEIIRMSFGLNIMLKILVLVKELISKNLFLILRPMAVLRRMMH